MQWGLFVSPKILYILWYTYSIIAWEVHSFITQQEVSEPLEIIISYYLLDTLFVPDSMWRKDFCYPFILLTTLWARYFYSETTQAISSTSHIEVGDLGSEAPVQISKPMLWPGSLWNKRQRALWTVHLQKLNELPWIKALRLGQEEEREDGGSLSWLAFQFWKPASDQSHKFSTSSFRWRGMAPGGQGSLKGPCGLSSDFC